MAEMRTNSDDWYEGLAFVPLRESGLVEQEQEARALVEPDPARAASLFGDVAAGLAERGYGALADVYSEWAAFLFEEDGDSSAAVELLVEQARREIDRGSGRATHTVRHLSDLLDEDQGWLGLALQARADWPQNRPGAIEALQHAVARLTGEEAAGHESLRDEFIAALVELLSIDERYAEVPSASAILRDEPISGGLRLQVELDALEALESEQGADVSEPEWRQLLRWAEGRAENEIEDAATAWQRRGVVLAVRGEVDESRAAFQRAAANWNRRPGFEDQVREAYFASQTAAGMNAIHTGEGERLRRWAATLRGNERTPATQADALEEAAMNYRIHENFPDALRSYWLAFAAHRRVGNLRGQLACLELIGELNVATKHPDEAAWAFVRAGREKKAADVSGDLDPDQGMRILDLGPARWRRTASYAVIAEIGRRLGRDQVRTLARLVLTEALGDADSLMAPQPAVRAQEALAALVFEFPSGQQKRALHRLRTLAQGSYIGSARPAAEALSLVTNAGVSDETETLLDAFLDDASLRGISALWIGEQLQSHPDAAKRIRDLACDGNDQALEAAAVAEMPNDDPELVRRCAARITALVDREEVQVKKKDGQITRSIGLGGYESSGLFARFVKARLRNQFAEKMAALVVGRELPFSNRASAANALFNVAGKLRTDLARSLASTLEPVVIGEIESSEWDPGDPDPLSRFRISQPGAWYLQGAALGAWSKLRPSGPKTKARDTSILSSALVGGDPFVVAAAMDALTRMPHVVLPGAWATGLGHPDDRVRAAAVGAWLAREGRPPEEPVLGRLLSDSSLRVRLTLLTGVGELDRRVSRPVLHRMREDVDAYVRALARFQSESDASKASTSGRS